MTSHASTPDSQLSAYSAERRRGAHDLEAAEDAAEDDWEEGVQEPNTQASIISQVLNGADNNADEEDAENKRPSGRQQGSFAWTGGELRAMVVSMEAYAVFDPNLTQDERTQAWLNAVDDVNKWNRTHPRGKTGKYPVRTIVALDTKWRKTLYPAIQKGESASQIASGPSEDDDAFLTSCQALKDQWAQLQQDENEKRASTRRSRNPTLAKAMDARDLAAQAVPSRSSSTTTSSSSFVALTSRPGTATTTTTASSSSDARTGFVTSSTFPTTSGAGSFPAPSILPSRSGLLSSSSSSTSTSFSSSSARGPSPCPRSTFLPAAPPLRAGPVGPSSSRLSLPSSASLPAGPSSSRPLGAFSSSPSPSSSARRPGFPPSAPRVARTVSSSAETGAVTMAAGASPSPSPPPPDPASPPLPPNKRLRARRSDASAAELTAAVAHMSSQQLEAAEKMREQQQQQHEESLRQAERARDLQRQQHRDRLLREDRRLDMEERALAHREQEGTKVKDLEDKMNELSEKVTEGANMTKELLTLFKSKF